MININEVADIIDRRLSELEIRKKITTDKDEITGIIYAKMELSRLGLVLMSEASKKLNTNSNEQESKNQQGSSSHQNVLPS